MLDCGYFAAGVCRSCSWIEQEYDAQLTRKQELVASRLPSVTSWLPAERSPVAGFRNKAKMVVAGQRGTPTLGILSPEGRGVDLVECGLHTPGLQHLLPRLSAFVAGAGLTPYSVPDRSGELKHLIVTESPDGELMVRFVLRSRDEIGLVEPFADAAVVSVNLQPEHKAILEGPEEIAVRGSTLTMRVNDIPLHLRPQSFFQTNTTVAAALYRHARSLVDGIAPSSVWDLYCGVGGFGLHLTAAGRSVVGVEASEQAVEAARQTASEIGASASFLAGDAAAFAASQEAPDLVVVNPPRRGIGALAGWLESSAAQHVLYSSCNAESLARDLAAMPSFTPVGARLLDMFPNTPHHEVLVLLSR